jgi:hypothetical protein
MATGGVVALPIQGEGKTFASLVRSHGGDVTTVAVLRELERLQMVTRSECGLLRVKTRHVQAQLRESARFRDFGRLLADFSETAAQVLGESQCQLYFGFKDLNVATESQAARFKTAFGRRASLLLDSVEHWRSREIGNTLRSRRDSKRSGQRVGVGVYLVEGRTDPGPGLLRNR